MPRTFIPADTHIPFIRYHIIAYLLSFALILGSAGLLVTKGLNFGIDFTGGIVIDIRTETPLELVKIRSLLGGGDLGEVSLQHFGAENDIMIRVGGSTSASQSDTVKQIKTLLGEAISQPIDYRRVDFVGPQVGQELIMDGLAALLASFLGILAYIWVRFEWHFGLGALVALAHDVILTLGLYSLLEIEFNLTSIAAILTIIGYSINDSVVIYDRVRDNLRKYKKRAIPDILDTSLNETLSRTILTAGTTVAALVALVWFGGAVIQGFSIAVLFGVIVGTYSSIYVAAPILLRFNLREGGEPAPIISKA